MKELTLREKEDDFLKLNIGEESYLIPLASSMTLDEIKAMDDKEKAFEFIQKHTGGKIKIGQYMDVITAWQEASNEALKQTGHTVGES